MRRALLVIAVLAMGCTTIHPALRDLADHDVVGDPEGYTKAEWVERLEKAASNDKLLDGDDRIKHVLRRCEDCNGSWTKFEKDDGIPGAEGFLSGDSGPRVKTAPRVAALEARAKAEAIAAQEAEQRGLEGAPKKIEVAALMAKMAQLVTSGDVEALERQWSPLHEAYDDLARTSRTLARSLERECFNFSAMRPRC